jgi:transposase
MPFPYDITKDIRYQQGLEYGFKKYTRSVVENLLADGQFSLDKIAKTMDVSIDFVIQIQNELKQKNKKQNQNAIKAV